MKTLLLDRDTWGLCIDANGNVAIADEPYALAQDAASAIRCFQGEQWFNTQIGVPYFQQVLGKMPPLSLLKAFFEQAALTVPNVETARCYIASFDLSTRALTGQVQITDANGVVTSSVFALQVPTAATPADPQPIATAVNATLS